MQYGAAQCMCNADVHPTGTFDGHSIRAPAIPECNGISKLSFMQSESCAPGEGGLSAVQRHLPLAPAP